MALLNSKYNELFISGRFELVEGSHITEDVSNGLILSKNCAEKNGLKLGDKVSGINDPNNNDPEVDMEIVGLFDVVADKEMKLICMMLLRYGIILIMLFAALMR